MKKLLLLITLSLTLFLTGCKEIDEQIQDTFDIYSKFVVDATEGKEVDVDGVCERVFVDFVEECKEEYSDLSNVEEYLSMELTLLEMQDIFHEDFEEYNDVFVVKFEAKYSYEDLNAEIIEVTDTQYVIAVRHQAAFKLIIKVDAESYLEETE